MLFNSLTYIFFLVFVVAAYWSLPRTPRLWLLFLASLLFYGFWRFDFIPLLLISSGTDFVAARLIQSTQNRRVRRLVLVVALGFNLALLAFFKYTIFIVGTVAGLGETLGLMPVGGFSLGLHIVLPLGISFYTFQSMSYTIDAYRGVIKAEKDYLLFANFVLFFPQLVAGPILRGGEVIWQLDKRPAPTFEDFGEGLRRIASGLFLKCVLADNIASVVDRGFATPIDALGGIDIWTLAFLFGFQIYFDFAGYSHVALGSAHLMGIRFPENFDFPYLATSPRDFWRRWHISLSSWIRDYLYLPLCGARAQHTSADGLQVATDERGAAATPGKRMRALWLTWALMGLWHGANWTFVIWGLWHAGLVTLQRVGERLIPVRVPGCLGWALTLPFAMLGWIPFRARSMGDAAHLILRAFSPSAYLREIGGHAPGLLPPLLLNLHRDAYYTAALMLLGTVAAWACRGGLRSLPARARPLTYALEALAFVAIVPVVLIYLRPINQFIYFQF